MAAFGALLLATLDVRGQVDGRGFACGAAYDVALLERECSMGGDLAPNQRAVDRAGVATAWARLGLAGRLGLVALGAGVYAGVLAIRLVRQRGGDVVHAGTVVSGGDSPRCNDRPAVVV